MWKDDVIQTAITSRTGQSEPELRLFRFAVPGDVLVAEVCIACTHDAKAIKAPCCLTGWIRTMLFHLVITCCNSAENSKRQMTTETQNNCQPFVYLPDFLSLAIFSLSHPGRRPWAGRWQPHRRPHSIACSCNTAPSRSHCPQWRTYCSFWVSLWTHTFSSRERTARTHRQRCTLGEAEGRSFNVGLSKTKWNTFGISQWQCADCPPYLKMW